MDIHTDWSTTAAIVGTLATVLGFIYGVITNINANKKSKNDEEDTPCEEEAKAQDKRTNDLEKVVNEMNMRLQKAVDKISSMEENYDKVRKDFLDNLARIENRLEKMIDLIIRIKDK